MCLGGRGQEKGEDSSLYVKASQQPSNHILKGVCVFVGVCVPGITEADIIPFVIQKMWKGKGRNSSCWSILGSVKIHFHKYRVLILSISFVLNKNESLDLSKFLGVGWKETLRTRSWPYFMYYPFFQLVTCKNQRGREVAREISHLGFKNADLACYLRMHSYF